MVQLYPPYNVWFDGLSDDKGTVKLGHVEDGQLPFYFYVPGDDPVRIEKLGVVTTDCYGGNTKINVNIWAETLAGADFCRLLRDFSYCAKLVEQNFAKKGEPLIHDQPFAECATCAPDMDADCPVVNPPKGVRPATVFPVNPPVEGNVFLMRTKLSGYPARVQVRGNFPVYFAPA